MDKQIDVQVDKLACRQTDKWTGGWRDRQTILVRWTDTESDKHTDRQTHRWTDTENDKHTNRQIHKWKIELTD